MIFYNGELVDYKNASEKEPMPYSMRIEIENTRNEYFGKGKKGFVQLRYPNGVRQKNVTGKYEPKKIFLLDMVSFDGMWRFSPVKPKAGKFNNPNGNHIKISDPYLFYEEDLELVWFLKKYCPQVLSGKVYFDDFEKNAEKEANEIAGDIDIKYALYSKSSPTANDTDLLMKVASVFAVEDCEKMGKLELKNALYRAIKAGEERKDKYVNLKMFEELTDNSAKLRAVYEVRKALANDSIKWRNEDSSWWIHAGGEYLTMLLKLSPTQRQEREQILFNEVLSKPVFKGRVFAELGISGYTSKAEVKELGRPALMTMCKDEGIEFSTSTKLDDLVELYCDKKGITKP